MMKMKSLAFALGVLGAAWLLQAALPTPQPKAVASVAEVMQAMVVPASNALWNVARQAPANDEEWAAIRNQAVLLAESGNLLLMPDRALDSEVWRETSLSMIEAGAAALEAAREKNADGVIDAGNMAVDACEICHEKHWER